MPYPLFELATQLRVSCEPDSKDQKQLQSPVLSPVQPKKPVPPPRITLCSHRQIGNATVTVLVCNVEYLILRYEDHGHSPIVKDLPWFQDPKKAICAITLDERGQWAVAACSDRTLFIIPVLALLGVHGSKKGNPLWRTNDLTKINITSNVGIPSAVVWWHSLDDRNIIVMGTEKGEVVLVDLVLGRDVRTLSIDDAIASVEVIRHEDSIRFLLAFTRSGSQWGMLLERSSDVTALTTSMEMDAQILDYEVIRTSTLPTRSILHADGDSPGFAPVRFQQFTQNIQLTSQFARGRALISGHYHAVDIFKIYDSSIDNWMPLYVYRIPTSSLQVVFTDRLLFCISVDENSQVTLTILSNQKSEVSSPDQLANRDAIMQTFHFPEGETFVRMYRHHTARSSCTKRHRGAPSMQHGRHSRNVIVDCNAEEEGGESSEDDYYSTSSEIADSEAGIPEELRGASNNGDEIRSPPLNGCVVVTSRGVYHCRPRISPEGLFLELALSEREGSAEAENLGITLGLDMNALYEQAADTKIADGDLSRALNLYRNSQCSFVKQATNLAKHGHIAEILSLVSLAFSRASQLGGQERRVLANMAIKCFVYEILDGDRREELMFNFKSFLMDNFDYNEDAALELFASCGLHDILVDVAKARGKLSLALDLVLKSGLPQVDGTLRKQLVAQGYITKFSAAGDMAFVRCMPPQQAITHLLTKPELIFRYTDFVKTCLDDLDIKTLLKLAHLFDPSKPTLRPLLKSQRERSHSTASASSHDSFKTAPSSTDFEDAALFPKPSVLIELFLIILLKLNKKRRIMGSSHALENGHDCEVSFPSCIVDEQGTPDRLPLGLLVPAQNVLACGQDHTAIVANGDVYTWGRAHEGRLGQGDIMSLDGRAPPLRVETLHMHGIKVRAVACGKEHTMAITQEGKLYGWGSSFYGQLGVGDTLVHSRPVAVEALCSQRCMIVACGQLHTLVLTQDQRLWSFGWGVHGQLGHGDVEDQILPKPVPQFSKSAIVGISAGYAHSGILTSDGQVWTIGSSTFGQLGSGSVEKSSIPVRLEALGSHHVVILTCGYYSNIAITSNPQKVYTWGKSPLELRQALQLARKRHQSRYNPDPHQHHQSVTRLPSLPHETQHLQPSVIPTNIHAPIKKVTISGNHYLMLTTLGQLYAWGSNESGQLGMGNRVNQSVPVLMNRNQDDLFAAVASGSRFSLAINYQNQVLAWGSAEYGKLGMESRDKMGLPSYPSSSGAYPDHHRGSIGSKGGVQTSFLQPTIIPGVPAVHVERESIASCDSSDESSDGDDEMHDVGVLESIVNTLPDLASPDEETPVYGQSSLSLALSRLQSFYNSSSILQHSLRTQHWRLAAELSHMGGDYVRALGYSLRDLEIELRNDDQSHFQEKVLATVDKHLRLALEKANKAKDSDVVIAETGKQLLIQIFHFWHHHSSSLPMPGLESLLLPHLDQLALPLSSLMFSANKVEDTGGGSLGQGDVFLIPPAFTERFSIKFCLEITGHLVAGITEADQQESLLAVERTLAALGPANELQETQGLAKEEGNSGDDVTEQRQVGRVVGSIAPPYIGGSSGMVPEGKLWQEILLNLRKDVGSHGCVRLSAKDVNALVPTSTSKGGVVDSQEGESTIDGRLPLGVGSNCVVFTCGHHYQQQELRRQLTAEWGTDMAALPTTHDVVQKALHALYSDDGVERLPGACPSCIHSAILACQKE